MGLFRKSCMLQRGKTSDSIVIELAPNPESFVIQELLQIGKQLIVKINYPGCNNFEGNKILLFKGLDKDVFLNMKSIDPHFAKEGISPFARFQPTQEGWEAAILLASLIS